MIGGGIFAVLGLTIYLAKGAAPVAFFVAGLVALITAYSYAKLSVRYPSEGGTVEFFVRGFGPGFLSGWLNVLLLLSYVIMITLYSYAFGAYASSMILGGESWFARTGFAWIVIGVFTLLNALGAYVVGKVEDAMVLFKVAVLLIVGGAGLLVGDPGRLAPPNWAPLLNVLVGGFIIFLAYEGFELIANAAKDVRDPEKNIPRALYASVIFVMFVYIMVAAAAVMNLTYEEVIKYRDYALAVAAKPALGELGFVLVGIAALASTASAINATLYGTARISYVVAKYGELPERWGRKVWGTATEGLIFISLSSALAVAVLPLESISLAGSLGFLTVFAAVNYVNFKLRKYTKANPLLALLGFTSCLLAAVILVSYNLDPIKLEGALAAFLAAFLIELYVLKVRKVRLREFIDKELEERERLLKEFEKWIGEVVKAIEERPEVVEVKVVGGMAEGRVESSHDVDLLVRVRGVEDLERYREELEEYLRRRLKREYPVHVHVERS
ncbi:MAG: APC family permease [Crenarchaeota archaeon]|nr:APC family permease [Thermoproteota archaeon]